MEPEIQPKKSRNRLWIILLILLLLALAGFVYWYFMMRDTQSSTPSYSTTKVSTSSSTPATASAAPANDTALITAALVTKTGTAADMIAVTVSTNDGKYAKGTVGTKGEETGGGYFLAVKINSDWVIVYSGQATPNCSDVNPHNFPAALVSECLDANGAVVSR